MQTSGNGSPYSKTPGVMPAVFLGLCVFLIGAIGSHALTFLQTTQFSGLSRVGGGSDPATLVVNGRDFTAIQIGRGTINKDGYQIIASSNGQSIVSVNTNFQARTYSTVKATLSNVSSSNSVVAFWRSSLNPERLTYITLSLTEGAYTAKLSAVDHWDGTVTEVAIGVIGAINQPITLHELQFTHSSWAGFVEGALNDWMSVRRWKASSINYVSGHSAGVSPTRVFGLTFWIGTCLVLLRRAFTKTRARDSVAVFTCGLLCWLSLDALWLARVVPQAAETKQQLSGQTLHARKLADFDGKIYELINTAEKYYLPPERQSIAIITAEVPQALLERAAYHMLPAHQPSGYVQNGNQQQYDAAVESSDYILVLALGSPQRKSPASILTTVGLTSIGTETFVVSSQAGALLKTGRNPATGE